MDRGRIVALVLIATGALGLAYGGFSYTKETHDVTVGPLRMSVDEKQRVSVPVWAGVGAIMIGGLLFATSLKRSRPGP